ncbi:ATP-binding cassette domain-containing protein [Aliarcobacter butzleri]|uniref:ATP-binding cassette domain-containing protein n=1 Tax=Aliarcobacter butzleri TaxID=28197 RepID=UPI002B24313D|nr:ATP-binding cassette domain-containing protein [Aliarcobacter butzleri]
MELNRNNIEKLINHKCYFDEFISKIEKKISSMDDKDLLSKLNNIKTTRKLDEVYGFCMELNLNKIDVNVEKYNIIKFENVKLNLKNSFQLNNITFNIIKGEKVLILGKNGSGKSSLLKLISGKLPIYYDKESTMRINNLDCFVERNWLEINKKILFLSNLDTKWKSRVGENIKFSTLSNEKEIDKYKNFLEYEKYKSFKWHELSNGFKSRFLLVYGFLKKPELLLLDEPFSTLDSISFENYLYEIKIIKEYTTMIFTSQTLSNLEDIVDKVIYIHNNSVKCFEKQEILKKDKFCYEIHFDEEVSSEDKEHIFCEIINENKKELIGESNLSKNEIFNYLIKNNISISFFKDIKFSFELAILKYKRGMKND